MSNYSQHNWFIRRFYNIIKIYSWNVFERELDDKIKFKDINGVEILQVTRLDQITKLESDKLKEAGFDFLRDKELVNNGCTLFYAFVKGKLAHATHVFVGPNAQKLHPLNFAMDPVKKIVGLAAFTHPSYRRKGLHLYTRTKVFEFLLKEGYKHVWDVQNKNNVAVKKSVIKIGYHLWGIGYRIRLLTFFFIDIVIPKNKFIPKVKIYIKARSS